MKDKKIDDVFLSVEEFSKSIYGVDIFKLESPINANKITPDDNDFKPFKELDKLSSRPWVMLSAGAGKKECHIYYILLLFSEQILFVCL